jgi:hypothetical protein
VNICWVIDDPLSASKTAAAMVALFSQLQLASLEKLPPMTKIKNVTHARLRVRPSGPFLKCQFDVAYYPDRHMRTSNPHIDVMVAVASFYHFSGS